MREEAWNEAALADAFPAVAGRILPLRPDAHLLAPLLVICCGPTASVAGSHLARRLAGVADEVRPYVAVLEQGVGLWRDLTAQVPGAPDLAAICARLQAGGAARATAWQHRVHIETDALLVCFLASVDEPLPVAARQELRVLLGPQPVHELLLLLRPGHTRGPLPDLAAWRKLGPGVVTLLQDQDARGQRLDPTLPDDLQRQAAAVLAALWLSGGAAAAAWQPLLRAATGRGITSLGIARVAVEREPILRAQAVRAIDAWLARGLLDPAPPDPVRSTNLADDGQQAIEAVQRLIDTACTKAKTSAATVLDRLADQVDDSLEQEQAAGPALLALLDERLDPALERIRGDLQGALAATDGPLATLTAGFAAAMVAGNTSLTTLRAALTRLETHLREAAVQGAPPTSREDVVRACEEAWRRWPAKPATASWWSLLAWYLPLAVLGAQLAQVLAPSMLAADGVRTRVPLLVAGIVLLVGIGQVVRRRWQRTGTRKRRHAAITRALTAYADGQTATLTPIGSALLATHLTEVLAAVQDLITDLAPTWHTRRQRYLAEPSIARSSREYGLVLRDGLALAPAIDAAVLDPLSAGLAGLQTTQPGLAADLVDRLLAGAPALVAPGVAAIATTDLLAAAASPPAALLAADAAPLFYPACLPDTPVREHRLLFVDAAHPALADAVATDIPAIPSLDSEAVTLVTIATDIAEERTLRVIHHA